MDNGFSPGSASDIVKFQVERNVVSLYKNFLNMLEDIRDGEPVNYERQRKRILDIGNNAIREIEAQIDLFDINFKR